MAAKQTVRITKTTKRTGLAATRRPRKTRSDKGKKRGKYRKRS